MADNGDWRASLPPEYQTVESLGRFKSTGDLVKSYLDMEKFVSSTGRVPREDASSEDWGKFYTHWGRPEKAEYKVPDVPKEYGLDKEFQGNLMKIAHDMGLNQKQFNQMVMWGTDQTKGIFENQQRARDAALGELKSEWGYRYETNRDRAHKTVAMLVDYKPDHPFVQWLQSTGNEDNPVVLRFFHELSNRLGEDNFVTEQARREANDKQSAIDKINEVNADMKHPYWNDNDPRHKSAVEEMARLMGVAYGEE